MQKFTKNKNIQKIFALFIALALVKMIGTMYLADVYYEKSQDLLPDQEIGEALVYANKAIRLNPLEANYYRGRAKILVSSLVFANSSDVKLIKNRALNDLEKAYRINPNNLVVIRNSIPLYYYISTANITEFDSVYNIDPIYFEKAKIFFSKVKNISRNDVGVYVLLAKYEKKLGLMSEYEESIKKIRELRPDLLEWYLIED